MPTNCFFRRSNCLLLVAILCVLSVKAQQTVLGTVQDAFLKAPLPAVKVSLLAADSTVLQDSIPLTLKRDERGTVKGTTFMLNLEKKTCRYLLHATCKGYTDAWATLDVVAEETRILFMDKPLELRRIQETQLGEVEVTATKLKMYYKGDTLVYDATAFKLPDGSMLDGLIRQLPGVTMNDAGEIFVNGRKVEELLLGSRSFFGGDKKVLIDNLPYYTVKAVKVYEQQTDVSRAMGWDAQPKKFVMDVNLKNDYKNGYIGNVEVAAGTKDRWLGRAFLLGFSENLRFTLLANGNNVNEKRHIGESDSWSPDKFPTSIQTTHNLAGELDYQSADGNIKNSLILGFAASKDESETRRRHELFLDGTTPYSLLKATSRAKENKWSLRDNLKFIKPKALSADLNLQLEYKTYNGRSCSRSEEYNDSLTTSLTSGGFNDGHSLLADLNVESWIRLKKGKVLMADLAFKYSDDKNESARQYHTIHYNNPSNVLTHNASDYRHRQTFGQMYLLYEARLKNKFRFRFSDQQTLDYRHTRDFLYHPDTLLLPSEIDLLLAITDPNNSYESDLRMIYNTPILTLSTLQPVNTIAGTEHLDALSLELFFMARHEKLDYMRGATDTTVTRNMFYINPTLGYTYYHKKRASEKLSFRASYIYSATALTNLINYVDDATPQVVVLGNPQLKNTATSRLSAEYTDTHSRHEGQMLYTSVAFNYHHRNMAQSVTYNPINSVYTYKPMNVSGDYEVNGTFKFTRPIDKTQHWLWQTNTEAYFHHSVDHAMLTGETESRENSVNTLTLHEGAWIQYGKKAMNIRLTGDIRWRHSEGRMQDFSTLDALDYHYGFSARYTIPQLKTTIAADATIYSRRGYGSNDLNTDDFVLNASISQSFLKGRLVARIEAFDLLHQLSNTQYEVNAQGRTETWQRSLPNYIMAHIVYHFNKNPKKK